MKEGDKVFCIKNLIRKNDSQKYIVVLKSKKYTILEIKLDVLDKYIKTTSENGEKYWSIKNFGTYFIFSDYFISEKELRKDKIKKNK
jgi:hypothetical protein